jgi:phosphoserine phosphatase
MDGVLVDIESSWSYVHDAFKVGKNDNLSRYLNGQIDFRELMRRDIRLWGRVHLSVVENVLSNIPIMKGAGQAVFELRRAGCRSAIISAGVSVLADRLQRSLGIDYSLANGLAVDENGVLTGEGEEVVPLMEKAAVLRCFASEHRTSLDDFAAVGDSKYDIPLFEEVGLSIAFNTKDNQVMKKADIVIVGKDLSKIVPHILRKEW